MSQAIEKSAKDTVIFDGDCSFCQNRVAVMKKDDSASKLNFLPFQSPEAQQRFPQIKDRKLDDGILLVKTSGDVHVAADAIYEICKSLPTWQAKLMVLVYGKAIFKPFMDFGYGVIAANRKLLGKTCENGLCKIDPPHEHKQ